MSVDKEDKEKQVNVTLFAIRLFCSHVICNTTKKQMFGMIIITEPYHIYRRTKIGNKTCFG
jgi:hypothetical protein